MTPAGIRSRFEGVRRMRVAIEVGTHSPWVKELLEELGHEVIVANPRKVRLIGESRNKDDKLDAERLARLARVDPLLLSPVRHRGREARADLGVARSREALVKVRTDLINHVRGSVKPFGGRVRKCGSGAFAGVANDTLPDELRAALEPILDTIASLTEKIHQYDKQIEKMVKDDTQKRRMCSTSRGWDLLLLWCTCLFWRIRSVSERAERWVPTWEWCRHVERRVIRIQNSGSPKGAIPFSDDCWSMRPTTFWAHLVKTAI